VTSVQNAEDLLQSVRTRVEEARPQQLVTPRPQSPPPSIVKAKAAAGVPQIVTEPSSSPPPSKNPESATQALAAVSQSDSLNAAYWGFAPTVRGTVKDAVQIAVRSAIQEIAVPPGIERDQASVAYRKLVASSLVEAAKTADDYLRRASLWNEPPFEIRGSESTVIRALGEPIDDSIVGDPAASVTSKENVETYGNHVTNLVLPVDEMDSVPLDTDDKPKPKKKRHRPFKNGARFGYDAIPTRDSSKNRVLSTKTSATNVSLNLPRKRSFERILTRVNLRSVSSETSLKQDKAAEKPLLTTRELDRRKDRSSASMEITGRQNTVHWLKGLLSSNGPYEPRFTALPPRTERRPTRSQTAPVKPVEELYFEATPKLTNAKRDERADPSEVFTRTIDDLENLMNEALIIARQAAENRDAQYAPAALGNAAKVLKSGRDRYQAIISGTRDSEDSIAPSIHESLRSYSDSDMSYHSGDPELYVQPAKEPGKGLTISLQNPQLRKSSGWPPTGRVSTPYPPASTIPSKDSPTSPPEAVDYLTSADPRSLPTETELQRPRKASNPVEFNTNLDVVYYGDDGDPRPAFRNLEPFSSPISREATRKSSSRSPKRLSPTRQTQNTAQPDLDDYQDIPLPKLTPRNTVPSQRCVQGAHSEEAHQAVKTKLASKAVPNKQEVRDYIAENRAVPIQPRTSSQNLRKQAEKAQGRDLLSRQTGQTTASGKTYDWQNIEMDKMPLVEEDNDADPPQEQRQQPAVTDQPDCAQSFDGTQATEELDFDVGFGVRQRGGGEPSRSGGGVELQDNPDPNLPQTSKPRKRPAFSLRGKNHVSLNEHHKGFSLARSHKRQSIARDWSPGRKRFVALVACFSTALIGIIVGIYAGETPAIQYYIVDFHHYTVLGNVFFFIGLAIPTFFFWPLPLLHGRKPYILGSMSLAMPLLFPQALAVGSFRSPYVSTYRVGLILSRAVMGFSLGFANMNFKGMLTDLFGASLQSTNPHQEHVDEFDVRRHGGGMGVWLGLWTWSALGSIGLGFLIGAAIVNHLPPAWGFYVSICIIAFVMLLNVLCPEVRRSAFRRSVAEVVNGQEVSRRLARGEVKMHMVQSGPKWWGEEFHYGVMLSLKMLRQPGFMVMAVYVAWIYGQMVLNILVCGSFRGQVIMLTRNSCSVP
jgi:MFS family permease